MNLAQKIAEDLLCFHRNGLIDLKRIKLGSELQNEYYYAHLPLAVIDAVFSKGQSYAATAKVVNNYCDYYNIQRNRPSDLFPEIDEQESITQFMKKFLYEGEHIFRKIIFKNSEAITSKVTDKSKAMAVYDFAGLLQENGVEYFQDIEKILYDTEFFENSIKITSMTNNGLNYFFMLAVNDSASVPVRLIIDFIKGLSTNNIGFEYLPEIVAEVCVRLKSEFSNITPRILGFAIWEYMKSTKYDMLN